MKAITTPHESRQFSIRDASAHGEPADVTILKLGQWYTGLQSTPAHPLKVHFNAAEQHVPPLETTVNGQGVYFLRPPLSSTRLPKRRGEHRSFEGSQCSIKPLPLHPLSVFVHPFLHHCIEMFYPPVSRVFLNHKVMYGSPQQERRSPFGCGERRSCFRLKPETHVNGCRAAAKFFNFRRLCHERSDAGI